ncbi:MAG TPA: TatD family hydrolase [Candidatus Paceibacterota bacterium]|nr:TatD family hydrolase [Candidatus Paceibacterota bacterium]
MPAYIDIHSHLNFPQFDADRAEAIQRMRDAGIWTITVGTDRATSESAMKLAEENDGMFATVGVHPTHEEAMGKDELIALARSSAKVVAIGECGLDYYRKDGTDEAEKKRQREVFETHIEAAIELGLPLMIHGRAAYGDIYDILASYHREHGDKVRANMHFFAGSADDARKFLDFGFSLSFDGPITFANSYDEVIRLSPLEAIMAETDAPFAAPAPFRGRRNEPLYVREVARRIAEIRNDDPEKVREALVKNAVRIFGLEAQEGVARPVSI